MRSHKTTSQISSEFKLRLRVAQRLGAGTEQMYSRITICRRGDFRRGNLGGTSGSPVLHENLACTHARCKVSQSPGNLVDITISWQSLRSYNVKSHARMLLTCWSKPQVYVDTTWGGGDRVLLFTTARPSPPKPLFNPHPHAAECLAERVYPRGIPTRL